MLCIGPCTIKPGVVYLSGAAGAILEQTSSRGVGRNYLHI